MQIRNRFVPAIALSALVLFASPAHAASKEIIELQTQVQQLLDQMQRLQSTVDSRFGVVQHLVEQSTDSVNQMNLVVATMQAKLNAQSDSTGGKLDGVSGQVQSLNDSLDELKSRIAKLDKEMQDMQSQLQNVQSQPAAVPGSMPGGQPGQPSQGGQLGNQPGSQPGQSLGGEPSAPNSMGGGLNIGPATAQAPPLQDTYQSALRDYNSAHYDAASSEFSDVLHYYPQDDLAGNAQFYLGEIAYKQLRYRDAVKAYNQVLENFSGSPKAPAAQLRKGMALVQLNQKDAGVREYRLLIQRYPQTPEAAQARSKLNAMGVKINPRQPGA